MKVGGRHYRSLWADEPGGSVSIIDPTRQPHAFETLALDSPEAVAEAIETMRVRGAPLIGVAAAFGLALAMSRDGSGESLARSAARLGAARPTAVNLAWDIRRMRALLAPLAPAARACAAWREAQVIADEDAGINEAIGRHGLDHLLSRASATRLKLRVPDFLKVVSHRWLLPIVAG